MHQNGRRNDTVAGVFISKNIHDRLQFRTVNRLLPHRQAIQAFVKANVKAGATLLTDGHASYSASRGYRHDPRVVGRMAGHVALPWIHRVFALMKRWGLGTYHGLRRKHVDSNLDEFVFRYNRRFYRHVSFEALLGIASGRRPVSNWDIRRTRESAEGRDRRQEDAAPEEDGRRNASRWRPQSR
jgi:hypothetical protein